MESQKIIRLLNGFDNESSKSTTKKWYVIHDQNDSDYGQGNIDDTNVRFETKTIKWSLCDYADAYILVTGGITAAGDDTNTDAAFENCTIHKMHNLHKQSTYWYCWKHSWQFKRDGSSIINEDKPDNVTTDNSTLFEYKSSILEKPAAVDNNGVLKEVKIAVPLKYVSYFWRSIEMPFINYKIHLELR